MGRSLKALTGGALFLALALAGCGSSGSSTTSSSAQTGTASQTAPGGPTQTATDVSSEPPSTVHISLSSAVFQSGRPIGPEERAIPARYTCDGSNTSPPLRWSGVPPKTAELLLVVLDLNASTSGANRFFTWSVAGLKPTLHRLAAGRLPAGASVGRNGFGQNRYSVCPPKGQPHSYAIFLYAVRHRLSLAPGFDPNALYEKIGGASLPQGQSGFAYKRS